MDWADCPPITKIYLIGAVATSVAVQCHIATPFQLYFTYRATFEHGQLWRLASNFLYFGPLSLDFVFHLFFFMRYSKMLEENSYHGHRADYAWLLIVCCTLLLLLSPLSPAPFLSGPLSFTLVYLWARTNSTVRLSLFGVITITAAYLPFALVLFGWALNSGYSGLIGDLLGIAVGHVWYFFTEVWKRELASGEKNWLATPEILVRLIDGPEALNPEEEGTAEEPISQLIERINTSLADCEDAVASRPRTRSDPDSKLPPTRDPPPAPFASSSSY